MATFKNFDDAVKAMDGLAGISRMNSARLAVYILADEAHINPEVYLTDVLLGDRPTVQEMASKIAAIDEDLKDIER